jgi:hypothetical protein
MKHFCECHLRNVNCSVRSAQFHRLSQSYYRYISAYKQRTNTETIKKNCKFKNQISCCYLTPNLTEHETKLMTTHAQRVFQPLPQIRLTWARIVKLDLQAYAFTNKNKNIKTKYYHIDLAKCREWPQNCRIAAWPQVADQSRKMVYFIEVFHHRPIKMDIINR